MHRCLHLFALMCAAFAATQVGAAFDAEEKAAIAASGRPMSYEWSKAEKIVISHGKAADVAAAEWLLATGRFDLVDAMARAWPLDRQAQLELLASQAFEDPPVAAALLLHLRQLTIPALVERVLDDVDALARFRAEQRARCRLVPRTRTPRVRTTRPGDYALSTFGTAMIASVMESSWEPKCGAGSKADLAIGDDDTDEHPVQWRRRAALVALEGIAQVPAGRDPTRHLASLSLRPACAPRCSGDGMPNEFAPPASLVRLARKRGTVLPYDEVVAMLRGLDAPRNAPAGVDGVPELLIAMLAAYDSPASSRELADWILARANRRTVNPQWYKMALLPLGPRLPDSQVDLEPLRVAMSTALQGNREVQVWLTQVAEENRSLREPSAASLVRWMGHPKRRLFLPYLLEHGASVNGVGMYGMTPLMAAVIVAPDFVPALLRRGADVNERGAMERTPLMAAVQHREVTAIPAILGTLLAAGAKVDDRDHLGWTALHIAAFTDATAVTTLLRAGATVDARSHHGETPLFYAGRPDIARVLLAAGADPNRRNAAGESAFSHRSRDGPPEVASILAQAGGSLTPAQAGRRLAEFGKGVVSMVLLPFGFGPH